MIKNILVSVFALFVAFAMPSSAMANPGIEIVETDFQQISISYANSILRVTGAEGEVLQIYNVAGVRVMNVKVEGEDKRFEQLAQGLLYREGGQVCSQNLCQVVRVEPPETILYCGCRLFACRL